MLGADDTTALLIASLLVCTRTRVGCRRFIIERFRPSSTSIAMAFFAELRCICGPLKLPLCYRGFFWKVAVAKPDVRIYESPGPSYPEDIARASRLSPDECPRRYCWWWRSLSFEWEIPVSQGCTFIFDRDRGKVSANYPGRDSPCCRCDKSSSVDHFEPRDPHLADDGFDAKRWQPR